MKEVFRELRKLYRTPRSREPPLLIVDLATRDKFDQWRHGSDETMGGYSHCDLNYNEEEKALTFEGVLSTKLPENIEIQTNEPFMGSKRIIRSGFAGCNIPLSWFHQRRKLSGFNALKVIGRGDDQMYRFLVTPDSYAFNDLYQCLFQFSSTTEWQERTFHLDKFLLTGHGAMKIAQRPLQETPIKKIGFTIADSQEGPFKLEIKKVELIHTDFSKEDAESM